MKLKTTMGGRCLQVEEVFIDPENIEWYQAAKVSHDAMAAHALLQAMDEANERDEFVFTSNTTNWIKQRAAEILASWGVEKEMAG